MTCACAAATNLVVAGIGPVPLGLAPRRIVRMEILFGMFERVVPLPCPVDPDQASARLVDGLLQAVLPLADFSFDQSAIHVEVGL